MSLTAGNFPKTDYSDYPNRPTFTMLTGIGLVGLSTLGAFNAAAYLGSFLLPDDLLLYPIQSLRRNYHYITNGIKPAKSWIGTFSTLAGYLLGALFAYSLIASTPMIALLFGALVNAMGCNFMTLIGCHVIGISIANMLNKPAYLGSLGAILFASFLPITLPIALDIYGISILTGGFIASYLNKHLIRGIFYLRNGHANADGYYYNFDINNDEPSKLDTQQADKLGVDAELVKNLRQSLLKTIAMTRQQTSLLGKLIGADKACTGELKNILHLLMTANSADDKEKLTLLLALTVNYLAATYTNIPAHEADMLRHYKQDVTVPNAKDASAETTYQDTSIGLALIKHCRVFNPFPSEKINTVGAHETYHRHGVFSAMAKCAKADPKFTKANLAEDSRVLYQALTK